MKPPIFTQIKRQGITLLILHGPQGVGSGAVGVIDNQGNNYGSYRSLAGAKAFWKRNGGVAASNLGLAQLTITPIR